MAKGAYSKAWKNLLEEAKDQVGAAFFLEDATILNIEIHKQTTTNAFRKAAGAIFSGEGKVAQGKTYNQVQYWNEAYENLRGVLSSFEFGKLGRIKQNEPYYIKTSAISKAAGTAYKPNIGVHLVKQNQTKMVFDIILVSGQDTVNLSGAGARKAAEDAMKFIKDSIWDEWVDIVSAKAGEQILGPSGAKGKRFSKSRLAKEKKAKVSGNFTGTPTGIIQDKTYSQLFTSGGVKAAHKVDSTKGVKGLEWLLAQGIPDVTWNGVTLNMTNFAEKFLKGLNITARNTRQAAKTKGKFPKQTHLIEVRIDTNTPEVSDFQNIRKDGEEFIKNWVVGKIFSGEIDLADMETSKPFTKDLQDTAIRSFIEPLLKKRTGYKVINTVDMTPTKPHDYSVKAGKPNRKAGQKKLSGNLSFTGAKLAASASKRPRSQGGKQEKTYSLAQIKSYINRGLHNKIKQNMGRPALEYRTGQFARSVQLLDLRETSKTVQGRYTYQTTGGRGKENVYSTFEDSSRWPSGYNPKPLIARSIRELASQYTNQKFVLRRK